MRSWLVKSGCCTDYRGHRTPGHDLRDAGRRVLLGTVHRMTRCPLRADRAGVDALQPLAWVEIRFAGTFRKHPAHKTRMSLRDFMDLVVAEHGDPSEVFARTPLLGVRGIGKIGYYSVAAELTETDLGPRCNAEWQRRLAVLRREWRIPSWPPNPRRRQA